MTSRLRTAVFPVAGLGTRFLPATKAVPKEMLTVVDKPVIQYAVEEARAAGIEHFIMVTGRGKGAIEDHFDLAFELETTLRDRNKKAALEELVMERPAAGAVSFTRQQEPLGLGHAVWCARDIIGNEPFAVLLPDMVCDPGCLAQMVEVYNRTGGNVIAVEECDPAETDKYGIVGVGESAGTDAFRITSMVEKPKPADAPSNLYINGRYILQPEIFEILATQERGAGGEIQITDAMHKLMSWQPFHGVEFQGRVYDCGDKIGYLRATAALALANDAFSADARAALAEELAIAAARSKA